MSEKYNIYHHHQHCQLPYTTINHCHHQASMPTPPTSFPFVHIVSRFEMIYIVEIVMLLLVNTVTHYDVLSSLAPSQQEI